MSIRFERTFDGLDVARSVNKSYFSEEDKRVSIFVKRACQIISLKLNFNTTLSKQLSHYNKLNEHAALH